jgi:hypothetical protein
MTISKTNFSLKLLLLFFVATCSRVSAASLSSDNSEKTEEKQLASSEIEAIQRIALGDDYAYFMELYGTTARLLRGGIEEHSYLHTKVISDTTKVSFCPRKSIGKSKLKEWITLDRLPGFVRKNTQLVEFIRKIKVGDYSSCPLKLLRVVVNPEVSSHGHNASEIMDSASSASIALLKAMPGFEECIKKDAESIEKEFEGEVYEMIFSAIYKVDASSGCPDVVVYTRAASAEESQDIEVISSDGVAVRMCRSEVDPTKDIYVQCLQKTFLPINIQKGSFTMSVSDDSVDDGSCQIM